MEPRGGHWKGTEEEEEEEEEERGLKCQKKSKNERIKEGAEKGKKGGGNFSSPPTLFFS